MQHKENCLIFVNETLNIIRSKIDILQELKEI